MLKNKNFILKTINIILKHESLIQLYCLILTLNLIFLMIVHQALDDFLSESTQALRSILIKTTLDSQTGISAIK